MCPGQEKRPTSYDSQQEIFQPNARTRSKHKLQGIRSLGGYPTSL